MRVAAFALIAATASAGPAFSGVKVNVPTDAMKQGGWEVVYQEDYAHPSHKTFIDGYASFRKKVWGSEYLLFGCYAKNNPKVLTNAAIVETKFLFGGEKFKNVGTTRTAIKNN